MVFVCVHQGLRRDGLCRLTWEDIDRDGRGGWLMTVREKATGRNRDHRGKKLRTIPVLDVVRAELERWWQTCGQPDAGSLWGLDLADEAAIKKSTHLVANVIGELFRSLKRATAAEHMLHELPACILLSALQTHLASRLGWRLYALRWTPCSGAGTSTGNGSTMFRFPPAPGADPPDTPTTCSSSRRTAALGN